MGNDIGYDIGHDMGMTLDNTLDMKSSITSEMKSKIITAVTSDMWRPELFTLIALYLKVKIQKIFNI